MTARSDAHHGRGGILADLGTAYAKLLELPSGRRSIHPVREVWGILQDRPILAATGHGAGRLADQGTNELVALARGAADLLPGESRFTVVDCGARDIKCVRFEDARPVRMDWNTECGSFVGQTMELLRHHFRLRDEMVETSREPLNVTCGVLGMVRLFDRVAEGGSPADAYGAFVAGVARNVSRFAGDPEVLYLSGGLCENRAFLRSLAPRRIEPLGRFVLLRGLQRMLESGEIEAPVGRC